MVEHTRQVRRIRLRYQRTIGLKFRQMQVRSQLFPTQNRIGFMATGIPQVELLASM